MAYEVNSTVVNLKLQGGGLARLDRGETVPDSADPQHLAELVAWAMVLEVPDPEPEPVKQPAKRSRK